MNELDQMLAVLRRMHDWIRQRVLQACESQSTDELSRIAGHGRGDTIFAIDRISEGELVEFLEREFASRWPLVLVAEGLDEGEVTLPRGTRPTDARWRLIADPIDGTRCLMYQKRSGWILTGLAPNRGPQTSLTDILLAVQSEIPLIKQHLCDQMWAIRGAGARAERINRFDEHRQPLVLQPSRAETLRYGYAALSRFFPGARDVLAAMDEELMRRVLGPQPRGDVIVFEDQYPSTGGQIYSLAAGQDRFIADLRPLMEPVLAQRGESVGHCCHPYDICTSLIAEELGVQITAPDGGPLEVVLDVQQNVGWIAYANAAIRRTVEPALMAILQSFVDQRHVAPPLIS
ncbi:MAG: inositol monophosphatase [Planctomycetes bacterium]|nr:inositol monophosphatase [Planctomycetota bacterium]